MPNPLDQTLPGDRVPRAQKIGYGLGSAIDMWGHWLYPGMAYQVFNIYLGMSPALVARALFLNRIFDAVSDPLFGWLSDNTRTRFGRRRPYILAGSIGAGLGLPLLFLVVPGQSEAHYFWFMVLSSAIYIPVMSCFFMPYTSLGAELTPDYNERTSVFSVKSAIQKVPEVALFYGAQFTTLTVWVGPKKGLGDALGQLLSSPSAWKTAINEKPDILAGAQAYCAILGVLMVVCGAATFALTRERYYVALAKNQQKIRIVETLWTTLKCEPFRAQLVMVLGQGVGMSMVGTLGYYDTVYYVCRGDVALGARWNFAMGLAGMLFGLAGIPIYASIAKRFGKIQSMRAVFGTAIVVFVSTWWLYNPRSPWLQPLASGLIALASAGFWVLEGSIAADVMDSDELTTGKRREGSFAACKSWILKLGMAIGVLASGEILARTGFDAKLGAEQSEHALLMIRALLVVIPVLGYVVSLLALAKLPLTPERMRQIRRALEEKRGTV